MPLKLLMSQHFVNSLMTLYAFNILLMTLTAVVIKCAYIESKHIKEVDFKSDSDFDSKSDSRITHKLYIF